MAFNDSQPVRTTRGDVDIPSKTSEVKRAASPVARPLMSLRQVAAHLGVSERTVHKFRAMPWMPAPIELAPRVLRWVPDEIDAAIQQQAVRKVGGDEPAALARARAARSQGNA